MLVEEVLATHRDDEGVALVKDEPILHIDGKFKEVIAGEDYDREKELMELKLQARREEHQEVENLMSIA